MRNGTWKWLAAATLGAMLAACGGEAAEEPTPTPQEGDDEYADAIPDADMLSLGGGSSGQGLSSAEQGLADPSGFKGVADGIMTGLNGLLHDTHRGLRDFALAAPHVDVTIEGKDCRVWQAAWDGVEWRLASCVEERVRRKYAFLLAGRPEGSTSEDDFLLVFAGRGAVLPKFEARKRGAGEIGYDFDNLATLTGEAGLRGKMAVGYRAAGRARQLVVAMDGVQGEGDAQPTRAVFRFVDLYGRGGKFSWITDNDFLTRDAAGEVVDGQDGVNEFGRAAISWNGDGAARTVVLACGGTLGEACFRIAQCWTKDAADATFTEASLDPNAEPSWSAASCGEVVIAPEIPDEVDAEPPPAGENGTPDAIEPDAIPEEN